MQHGRRLPGKLAFELKKGHLQRKKSIGTRLDFLLDRIAVNIDQAGENPSSVRV